MAVEHQHSSDPELSHPSSEDDRHDKDSVAECTQHVAPGDDSPDGGTKVVYQEWYEINQIHGHTPSQVSWTGSTQAFFVIGAGIVGVPIFDPYGAKVDIPTWKPLEL
ncbi:hypothetical protein FQN49_000225 [Arthroderma sp. PD_2]|nr:hypothetical protein FQN49_000225 [Arthroderma sp. PD_2]